MGLRSDRALLPGVELAGHAGSAHGLYSAMFFDPQRKFGFVVVTNGIRDVWFRDEVNRALYAHSIAGSAATAAE